MSPLTPAEIIKRIEAVCKWRDLSVYKCECDLEVNYICNPCREMDRLDDALAALRSPAQEPVAWTTQLAIDVSVANKGISLEMIDGCARNLWGEKGIPLYTHSQPKPTAKEESQASESAEEWPSRTKVLTYILGREQEDIQWLIAKASMVLPKPTPVLTVEQVVESIQDFAKTNNTIRSDEQYREAFRKFITAKATTTP